MVFLSDFSFEIDCESQRTANIAAFTKLVPIAILVVWFFTLPCCSYIGSFSTKGCLKIFYGNMIIRKNLPSIYYSLFNKNDCIDLVKIFCCIKFHVLRFFLVRDGQETYRTYIAVCGTYGFITMFTFTL